MANCLYPEWHPQDAVKLTWPGPQSDWAPLLPCIEATLETVALVIARYQPVVIALPDKPTRQRIEARLENLGIPANRLRLHVAASDDAWARDHGPIGVARDGKPVLLDYRFTGWGGKFPAARDDALSQALADQGAFAAPLETRDLILEGGAIDTDGQGTLLTTSACLLNPNRNRGLSRSDIEARLDKELGIERFLWLDHGHLEGDDTDSHIDTLARFCNPRTIAYQGCDDETDSHYAPLAAMQKQLETFRQTNGQPYRLIRLPWPQACFDPQDGHRLPATYANFLIINGAVLMPSYADPADRLALSALARAFPDREIIPIDCRSVIRQHGSLHCLTMQLPRGSLSQPS